MSQHRALYNLKNVPARKHDTKKPYTLSGGEAPHHLNFGTVWR
jgi:hypothetical protein